MHVHAWSLFDIESRPLPGPSALICMADSASQLAKVRDQASVIARLDLVFNDAMERFQNVIPPSHRHAQRILRFVKDHEKAPNLVAQCQVGAGRSQAVQAALIRVAGGNRSRFSKGGHTIAGFTENYWLQRE